MLSELNDIEILILTYHVLRGKDQSDFEKKHVKVIFEPRVRFEGGQEERDAQTIHRTFKQKLVSLGLLKIIYKKPKRGELPEFDEKTGMMKAQRYEITPLGRLLLVSIDLAKPI